MRSGRFVVKLVEVVCAVEAQQFFKYLAIMDDRTCEQCNRYDDKLMTRREIYALFPYLEKRDEFTWFPRVHPNCRCILWLEEEKK